MAIVSYSMGMSLDGYIVGPDGGFQWSEPDEELFRFSIEEVRGVGVHLLGRKLYETMLYWEDPVAASEWGPAEREFANIWNEMPKVVFSSSLTDVVRSARLASKDVAAELADLRHKKLMGKSLSVAQLSQQKLLNLG